MTERATDWRDERVQRLEGRLYEAEDKIRALERRPMEWLLRAELVFIGLLSAAIWILVIVDAANKH